FSVSAPLPDLLSFPTRRSSDLLLNWKFPPECVAGIEGRDNLVGFIDTYLAKKGMHCQFNIMSNEMMKAAMKTPENYRDMLVRVADRKSTRLNSSHVSSSYAVFC